MTIMVLAAATLATLPASWSVSDHTDNTTGERRVFAEVSATEETPSAPDGSLPTFTVSCPVSGTKTPLFWINLTRTTKLEAVAVYFMPWMPDTPPDDVIKVYLNSSSVWVTGLGKNSLSPANSEAFASYLDQYSEKGTFKVSVNHEDGIDRFEFPLKGYRDVRQYLRDNCTPRSGD